MYPVIMRLFEGLFYMFLALRRIKKGCTHQRKDNIYLFEMLLKFSFPVLPWLDILIIPENKGSIEIFCECTYMFGKSVTEIFIFTRVDKQNSNCFRRIIHYYADLLRSLKLISF